MSRLILLWADWTFGGTSAASDFNRKYAWCSQSTVWVRIRLRSDPDFKRPSWNSFPSALAWLECTSCGLSDADIIGSGKQNVYKFRTWRLDDVEKRRRKATGNACYRFNGKDRKYRFLETPCTVPSRLQCKHPLLRILRASKRALEHKPGCFTALSADKSNVWLQWRDSQKWPNHQVSGWLGPQDCWVNQIRATSFCNRYEPFCGRKIRVWGLFLFLSSAIQSIHIFHFSHDANFMLLHDGRKL